MGIIRSKKFSLVIGTVLLTASFSAELVAQQRLPVIQNVGIIPPQWEGGTPGGMSFKKASDDVNEEFFNAVKRSQRFRVINDDLVKTSWSSPEGRQELVDTYELHAFVSLGLAINGETVRMVARLLAPDLKTYITESEAMAVMRLTTAGKQDIANTMKNLVYRLFNRMPVDVVVTSVQGRYVSLSGGSAQNLRVGDELDLKRVSVSTVHPADGSWLNFQAQTQGKVRIVDVKSQTSVASMLSQSYEGAIAVGDGLKVTDIPGRKHFFVSEAQQEFKDSGEVVVVAPKKTSPKAAEQKPNVEQAKPTPKPAPVRTEPVVAAEPEEQPVEQQEEETPIEQVEEGVPAPISNVAASAISKEGLFIFAGIENWNVSGAAKATSKMGMMFINAAGVRMPFSILPGWDSDASADLKFGSTKDGDYTGLGAGGRLLKPIDMGLGKLLEARIGGEAKFNTIAVNDETYGGGDYLYVGAVASALGSNVLFDRSVQWSVDFSVRPFAFGQFGIGGAKKSAGGFFGYALRGEAFLADRSELLNWGAALELSGFDAKAGSKLTQSQTGLYALLRYRM